MTAPVQLVKDIYPFLFSSLGTRNAIQGYSWFVDSGLTILLDAISKNILKYYDANLLVGKNQFS